jgi:hypothetical protein
MNLCCGIALDRNLILLKIICLCYVLCVSISRRRQFNYRKIFLYWSNWPENTELKTSVNLWLWEATVECSCARAPLSTYLEDVWGGGGTASSPTPLSSTVKIAFRACYKTEQTVALSRVQSRTGRGSNWGREKSVALMELNSGCSAYRQSYPGSKIKGNHLHYFNCVLFLTLLSGKYTFTVLCVS